MLRFAKASAGLVVLNGALGVLGYVIHMPPLYHWPAGPQSIAMAFPTTLGFLCVGLTLVVLIRLVESEK